MRKWTNLHARLVIGAGEINMRDHVYSTRYYCKNLDQWRRERKKTIQKETSILQSSQTVSFSFFLSFFFRCVITPVAWLWPNLLIIRSYFTFLPGAYEHMKNRSNIKQSSKVKFLKATIDIMSQCVKYGTDIFFPQAGYISSWIHLITQEYWLKS